jgi:hypothetical protein
MQEKDIFKQFEGTVCIRRLLAIPNNPPIEEIVEHECIPLLLRFLKIDNPSLQYECIWSLCNIASGSSVHTQVSKKFLRFLTYTSYLSMKEQFLSFWNLSTPKT